MKLLKEPLLHFLLLGAAIFAVHAARGSGDSAGDDMRIDVNAATISRLKDGWTRQFHRTPDAADMQGLIEAHVREEVLCREALAIGLDRDDTIVRRRMAQKMEFLTQDIATATVPDDAALEAYFVKNAARYARPAQMSFRHVYFSREKRGTALDTDALEALAALAQPGVSEETFGDGFLHGFEFDEHDEQSIAAIFGPGFAEGVMKAPAGSWAGPVTSSYGTHLVYVTRHGEPQAAEFATVREMVLRDFLDERRRTANDEVIERLKANYDIVIDENALKAATANTTCTAQAIR